MKQTEIMKQQTDILDDMRVDQQIYADKHLEAQKEMTELIHQNTKAVLDAVNKDGT